MIRGWPAICGLLTALALAGCAKQQDEAAPPVSEPAPIPPPATSPPPLSEAPRFEDLVSVAHILVRYEGAVGSHGVTRSREAALALATELSERAKAGEDFDALAVAHSEDAKSRARGGWIEPMPPASHPADVVARAAHVLAVGEVSDVVESPEGFHVLRRGPLEYADVRQVLITYRGCPQAGANSRSREEALARAEDVRRRALAGEDFAQLAATFGEDDTAAEGGRLDPFPRGRMVAPFERAAFALQPGEVSAVVETIYGFHVLRRDR